MKGRFRVAAYFGYLDAPLMVYMMETYGLPLSTAARAAKKQGLRIDFSGLRFELEMLRLRSGGSKRLNVDAELAEVRYFVGVDLA